MRRSNPALGLSKLRRAEAARLYPPPPKSLSCGPAAAFRVSFRSQSKGLERRPAPGDVFKRMQGISAFPHRRFRAQALSVCGRWMRLPACGIAPLRERRACVCLCIAAAFFALGFRAAYEEQRLCAADFLRTMRRRSERRGLSAACASRRRHGVHRPFFRRRSELKRPCLNARTTARLGIRRKRLGRISRAAPLRRGPIAPPQRRAETFPLLPIRRCFAQLPRRPALRVRRPERPPCAAALPNAAFPYGKSCNCTDSPKNNPNKPECRGDFRRKAGNVPIPRKPPPLAVFVCRRYNDMRQKNQTRRAGDAGDKAARTCRKADAALSAVRREAQARLYRQQWRSPKRGVVKAAVRRSTDCRYIHRRRKRCEGGRCNRRPAVRAVLPTAAARRPSPPARFKESVSGANATVPVRSCAAAGLRAVTARTTRTAALLVSFFAALPSGLPSGGGFTTISLCFLQPARS